MSNDEGSALAARNPSDSVIEWQHVAAAARDLFNVWVDQPELRWAEAAWGHLQTCGLTRYSTEMERCIVLFRLLALSGIYCDFCQVAWEAADKDYEYLAESMDLDGFVLGRLYQSVEESSANDDVEMSEAMETLVEAQRPVVVTTIQEGFGGDEELTRSLWDTRRDVDDFDHYDEDDPDLLLPPGTGLSLSKAKALDWVLGGCCPL